MTRYEKIGHGYASTRREDPRAARARCTRRSGDARTVVNVGAGAGSYEPADRHVVAIEPSDVMAAQRPPELAPAIRATAGRPAAARRERSTPRWPSSPSTTGTPSASAACASCAGSRAARSSCSPTTPRSARACGSSPTTWPELGELDGRIFPAPEQIAEWLGGARVEAVPIPRDTPDWTLGSFWAHPERVLDARARANTSGFARMPPAVVERVVRELRRDLEDGTWDARHGELRELEEYDAGHAPDRRLEDR